MQRTWLLPGAALPILLLFPGVRHAIESRMLPHMLLEFPMLLVAGACAGALVQAQGCRWPARLGPIDRSGLLGCTTLLVVSAIWMLPSALDLALLEPEWAWFKYLSWWGTGALLALGRERRPPAVTLFMLGNLAWMSATVGGIYQTVESRLCVSYLPDEQVWTGRGLVVVAVLLIALLAAQCIRHQEGGAR